MRDGEDPPCGTGRRAWGHADVHTPLSRLIDNLYLPKFSISSEYNLERVLPRLGVRQVFTKQADLSGVTGFKNLEVTRVSLKSVDVSPSVWELEGRKPGRSWGSGDLNLVCVSHHGIALPGTPPCPGAGSPPACRGTSPGSQSWGSTGGVESALAPLPCSVCHRLGADN